MASEDAHSLIFISQSFGNLRENQDDIPIPHRVQAKTGDEAKSLIKNLAYLGYMTGRKRWDNNEDDMIGIMGANHFEEEHHRQKNFHESHRRSAVDCR